MLIYLYFKVWKVERGPEQRAEVRYGGDFPPGLDRSNHLAENIYSFSCTAKKKKKFKVCSSNSRWIDITHLLAMQKISNEEEKIGIVRFLQTTDKLTSEGQSKWRNTTNDLLKVTWYDNKYYK